MSIELPTGKPATSRPPLITSSMANSSATRIGGLYSAMLFPSTTTAQLAVLRASEAAMMFGEGIMP